MYQQVITLFINNYPVRTSRYVLFKEQNTRSERSATPIPPSASSVLRSTSVPSKMYREVQTAISVVMTQAKTLTFALLIASVSLFSGCGKHEAAAGTVGATAGAIIGSSMTNGKDKTTAALIGGVIGNIIGGSAGRIADQEEAAEDRYHARTQELRERALAQREAELRRVHAGLDRWCLSCHRQNGIPGAHRCPSCGDSLVREKVCNGCLTSFSPSVSYRYCPYCSEKRILAFR